MSRLKFGILLDSKGSGQSRPHTTKVYFDLFRSQSSFALLWPQWQQLLQKPWRWIGPNPKHEPYWMQDLPYWMQKWSWAKGFHWLNFDFCPATSVCLFSDICQVKWGGQWVLWSNNEGLCFLKTLGNGVLKNSYWE